TFDVVTAWNFRLIKKCKNKQKPLGLRILYI
ncbi:MAG: hypothetical protein ACI9Z9_002482, partial [Litorivivens sp.]